ncbi:hypothetical protein, partial [Nonomuraea lactucae]|uniref:hypothetical protein n=1 Tax=Nonomuraea lactucae TaxID=2249762 RepID=UPI0013B3AF50
MPRSGLSARFALACAEASTNDRDELIRLVYHRVHCRLAGDGGWSDRGSAAECLRRASAALADRRVRHPGRAG